ncbi:hypothetical protein BJ508DRAFT_313688 [Ascobolus immersus RN42]|uniref:Uncharacterized protein n=1 Tax=Ascobolus immersus RN42 TaxID=1160509 RepID=A0A3N4HI06_ASCIM|nr:hypothetical protein BJ508DRAFT_313688 [Ascobolus immersus RN42]
MPTNICAPGTCTAPVRSATQQYLLPRPSISELTNTFRFYTLESLPSADEIEPLHTTLQRRQRKFIFDSMDARRARMRAKVLHRNERTRLKARRKEQKEILRSGVKPEGQAVVGLEPMPKFLQESEDPVELGRMMEGLSKEEMEMGLADVCRVCTYLEYRADADYEEIRGRCKELGLLRMKGMGKVRGMRELRDAIRAYEKVEGSQAVREAVEGLKERREEKEMQKMKLAHAKLMLGAIKEISKSFSNVDLVAAGLVVEKRKARRDGKRERRTGKMERLKQRVEQGDNDVQTLMGEIKKE